MAPYAPEASEPFSPLSTDPCWQDTNRVPWGTGGPGGGQALKPEEASEFGGDSGPRLTIKGSEPRTPERV